jgi:hypothetical protein
VPRADQRGRRAAADLAPVFRDFASRRCGSYAPLYAAIGAGIAEDSELLAIAANATPGQSHPDLMLAAAHYLLARADGHPLARFYPTLTAAPAPAARSFPLFRRFCLERRDQLTGIISARLVQTNEVRRCCYLLPAIILAGQLAGTPIALIEAGTSAGLDLGIDRYAYDYGTGRILGNQRSPLTLPCRLRGKIQPP